MEISSVGLIGSTDCIGLESIDLNDGRVLVVVVVVAWVLADVDAVGGGGIKICVDVEANELEFVGDSSHMLLLRLE